MKFRSMGDAPDGFRVETSFKFQAGFLRTLLDTPLLTYLISEMLIRQGKIFLRPYKVDPTKPDQYWLEGFKVKNISQRKDGTYLTSGSVHRFNTTN